MKDALRNYTVDIFRLFASFFIVFLHVGYDNMDENVISIVRISGRWGVPFFFLLSGYFFQKSLLNDPTKSVIKNCTRLLTILIVADIVYIITIYIIHGSFDWRHVFPGAYFHLWFLPSLILGTIVVYLFKKFNIPFFVTLIISVLTIFIVLLDSYSGILHLTTNIKSSYLIPLLSVPYMMIGAYFYNKDSFKKLFKAEIGLLLLVAGFILQIVEITVINVYTGRSPSDHQYLIGTLFLSLGIFILAFSLKLKNELLGKWGKDYSLFIYLYHPLIILFFYQTNYKLIFAGNSLILFPVMIFMLTLLLAIVTNKYLNYLFLILNGSVTPNFVTATKKELSNSTDA